MKRPDWFEILCRGMERGGVSLSAARAGSGEASIVLSGIEVKGARGALSLTITRADGDPCAVEVEGLVVRFRGGSISEDGRRALDLIERLLSRLRALVPQDLDSPFLRLPEGSDPAEALGFAYPFVTAEGVLDPEGRVRVSEALVRLTGRCNQRCPFCSAPPPSGEPSLEALRRCFATLDAVAPGATLTLTGGEPTLRPDLIEILELALGQEARGRAVELQTNAVRLSEEALVERLPSAGRLRCFVSLHSFVEETYRRCTGGRPGQLERALRGIERLLGAGYPVILSLVATRWNLGELECWVEAVARRFVPLGDVTAHFSITLCPDHRPGADEALVPYEELGPALEEALRLASRLELPVEPLLSSTHAAIPPCFLSPEHHTASARERTLVVAARELGGQGWRKGEGCVSCRFNASCLGVPDPYARRFGLRSLRPLG